ncbi:MAG: NAD(P)H-dependent oxidoreductase subunit E [Thermoflexales bacterium]|nr:NAD(P)H-dependent oxidoreductase subunit E [Thermoflexales bacterium]
MSLADRREEIEAILARYPARRSAVLPLLYLAQKEYGYCSQDAIREVAHITGLEPTEVRSVVGFYSLFHKRPLGQHVVQICDDLPCALRGADELVDHVCERLRLDPDKVRHGGQTTADGQFTVETVMCVAGCHRAPLAQIDLEYFENLTEQELDALLDNLGPESRD